MIRALAIKELREIGWIAVIGLALYGCLVGIIISPAIARAVGLFPVTSYLAQSTVGSYGSDRAFPFVYGEFRSHFWMVSFFLALALAFRQSLGEARGGTYGFLLHRPMRRRAILWTKIAVGLGVFCVTAALPVLVLAVWAATPGTHPSPFEWSMTLPAWKTWATMSIVYLATFLCGIRSARWYGSRLAPLAGVVVPLAILGFAPIPMWWLFGVVAVVLADALLVGCIVWAGDARDFA